MPDTIEVYSVQELSEAARERAREHFRATADWPWLHEWWQSGQEFSKIAPIEIQTADFERGQVFARWQGDEQVKQLSGLRAWKWLYNNGWFALAKRNAQGDCTLTGYCGDCPLFDPIAVLEQKPLEVPTLEQLFYECVQAWVHEGRRDLEHNYSDEGVDETLEANDCRFTAEGNLIPH